MWLTTLQHHPWPWLQWGVVLGAALAGAVLDARTRRIPNALTAPLLAGGFAVSTWVGGWPGAVDALAACALAGLPYVVLYAMAGGGAGDAKLMGALAAWLGVVQGFVLLLAVAICGGALALAFALSRRRLGRALGSIRPAARAVAALCFGAMSLESAAALLPARDETQHMPYGPAIFLGSLVSAGGVLLWQA